MFVPQPVITRVESGIRRQGFHIPDTVEHELVHAPARLDYAIL